VETLTRERRPARAARLRSAFTGADGNARLTATTGLILLVLLPTPVALKLGSTFYRFFRYYTGSAIFREKGRRSS
jgi:hypothetical protein